jgi:signal transduction histidine kinase/ActR/RegA family two-component response regulator
MMAFLISDVFVESLRTAVLVFLIVFLWRSGSRRTELLQNGWRLIVGGFSLLLVASLVDVSDNFEQLNRFVLVGDTPCSAMLKTAVGFLGGLFLIVMGLGRWVPEITSLAGRKLAEDNARRYAEELQLTRSMYEKQAAELEQHAQQLRVARSHAEQASRAKSEFLAHMSHEIRTPMTAILGYADILLDSVHEREELDAAQTIRRNGEYLLAIINDILDLSKIEAGKLAVDKTGFSPAMLIADVATLMRVRAEAKGLPLAIEYEGAIPEKVLTDPLRLRQILINLIGNAIKFTEVGSVRLVTRLVPQEGGEPTLQMAIMDTGCGIAQEHLDQLFKPFSQTDAATCRSAQGGTGLGLSISKRLAQMLGGDIRVDSQYGKGSTFTLELPTGPLDGVLMLERPADDVRKPSGPVKPDGTEHPRLDCRVLLAEDGPDNQRLIAFVLQKAGAEVLVAQNGQAALDSVMAYHFARRYDDIKRPFDLILMDMQMPVMDGYTAARRLREQGFDRPIIALTAHAMKTERKKCIDAGCDDYVTKPIDKDQLIGLVQRYTTQPNRAANDPALRS